MKIEITIDDVRAVWGRLPEIALVRLEKKGIRTPEEAFQNIATLIAETPKVASGE